MQFANQLRRSWQELRIARFEAALPQTLLTNQLTTTTPTRTKRKSSVLVGVNPKLINKWHGFAILRRTLLVVVEIPKRALSRYANRFMQSGLIQNEPASSSLCTLQTNPTALNTTSHELRAMFTPIQIPQTSAIEKSCGVSACTYIAASAVKRLHGTSPKFYSSIFASANPQSQNIPVSNVTTKLTKPDLHVRFDT